MSDAGGAAEAANASPSPGRRLARWIGRVAGFFLLGSVLLTALYAFLPPPATLLMLLRLAEGNGLRKDWVAYEDISPHLVRAVIAAEDAKFCQHNGFDWEAIASAWQRNRSARRIKGGSTISNQTAKNVFLWPDRTYARKALEFYFTFLIEAMWSKRRILEVYLNIAEFGPGLYGAEAAARAHFETGADALTPRQAALLAAMLPGPLRYSAARPSAYVRGRAATIAARMDDIPCDLAGLR